MRKAMPMPVLSYLDVDGNLAAGAPEIPAETLLKAYTTLVKTRMVDERMITIQRQGTISFALSSLGEEACAVGSAAALDIDDWMYPQYRETGALFWRGFSIQDYIDHMFGNANDLILGRQMPNHFGSRKLNVVTVSSPIGTKIPHAAGCGYAMKVQKEKSVAICYFGEGAASEGDFHAGLNFAAVRKAPTIFFCRNNGYAISTPIASQYAGESIAARGPAYGIKSLQLDGNDFFAVYQGVKEAKEHCLSTGPVLIEALTYRMGAHSTSDDPTRYRQEKEVESWINKCPVRRLKRYLDKQGLWSFKLEQELHAVLHDEIEAAIENAKKTPMPHLESLFEHVYFEETPALKRQKDYLLHRALLCRN